MTKPPFSRGWENFPDSNYCGVQECGGVRIITEGDEFLFLSWKPLGPTSPGTQSARVLQRHGQAEVKVGRHLGREGQASPYAQDFGTQETCQVLKSWGKNMKRVFC